MRNPVHFEGPVGEINKTRLYRKEDTERSYQNEMSMAIVVGMGRYFRAAVFFRVVLCSKIVSNFMTKTNKKKK